MTSKETKDFGLMLKMWLKHICNKNYVSFMQPQKKL